MKKLKLNLQLVKKKLSKEEMRRINGGFAGYCGDPCNTVGGGGDCPYTVGTWISECFYCREGYDGSEGECGLPDCC